jgi:hypothetical protein
MGPEVKITCKSTFKGTKSLYDRRKSIYSIAKEQDKNLNAKECKCEFATSSLKFYRIVNMLDKNQTTIFYIANMC